jgi:outer membrane protein assembly factor BamB
VAWKDAPNGGGPPYTSPARASDGTLYVAASTTVFALRGDGTAYWGFPTGNVVHASPTIGLGGEVAIGSYDRALRIFSAAGALLAVELQPDGTSRWSVNLGMEVDAQPAVDAAGTIYAGAATQFVAYSAAGKLLWSVAAPGVILAGAAMGADGTLYFGQEDGTFSAVGS